MDRGPSETFEEMDLPSVIGDTGPSSLGIPLGTSVGFTKKTSKGVTGTPTT